MTTPHWVQDAIFYQIFPDRFFNGDKSNDPINVMPWEAEPTNWSFHGGDLKGITQKLDYLLDLGINAIYLNPIFLSPSNHRYNTVDYYQIDPKLGGLADFKTFLNSAHQKNIRIILDGVFNHCGRGFFAFSDVLENGDHSPYKDWFHINNFPLDAYSQGDAHHYKAWWNIKSLPKFNTANPQVRKYIFDIARYWIEQGIDGWRLDVPGEIDDDSFWAELREVVLNINKDAYLLGEIWTADSRWANDSHFDGLMNYPVKDALFKCLNGMETTETFSKSIESILKTYPLENIYAMYNPLDSHDTERALTLLENDLEKAKLAYLYLMAYPGAPAIYYGSEIGLQGGKDPDCRRAFPWDEQHWRGDLRNHIKNLISNRKDRASLRAGEYVQIGTNSESGWYAFARTLGEEKTLIVMNMSGVENEAKIPLNDIWANATPLKDLITGQTFTVAQGEVLIKFKPWQGMYLA